MTGDPRSWAEVTAPKPVDIPSDLEPDMPGWARQRLAEEETMGGSFEGTTADRVGFSLGVFIALAWATVLWTAFIAAIIGGLYLVGKAMGWS